MARLVKRGVLHRAAQGYYVVIPQEYVGTAWLPGLEAVAAGIGTVMFGVDDAIMMGVSAARIHGVIPRSLGVAVVAVPRQRAASQLVDRDALVRFVVRDTARLDAELIRTELGGALVTTPEQTVLDLARRPNLGDAAVDVPTAIRALYRRSDQERLAELAAEQRMRATLDRVTAMVGE
ncbi:type IV toxin-antitoxin system AbiEi family antitoxin [Nocardia sp. NPDC059091]|uniref:type IV toxin-antitoxin system AbiEi family antitoxin domain-containing protein n=1 Tax=unclassified Nocardia TaxID=2637762 RepID=UPI003686F826